MKHIAKAVTALNYSSYGLNELDKAAHSLAYTCLRVVILGGHGLDVSGPNSTRLVKESYHFSKRHLRQRLQADYQELKSLLKRYPKQ